MKRLFYLVVAIQLLFLIGEVAVSERIIDRGQIVTLKCAPVDPRSLFMGNYMILSYEVSTVDLKQAYLGRTEVAQLQPGAPIYVGLVPAKPYAMIHSVSTRMPEQVSKRSPLTYLRGKIRRKSGSELTVEYGIERYYIPEARQPEVVRISGLSTLAADVAIDKNGAGIIKRLLADGKPVKF